MRCYQITSSLFESVLSRRADTPPDNLVLRIIQPKSFSTPATKYGIENELVAIEKYIFYQQSKHPEIAVSPTGFYISVEHPFLGASPDGAMYYPANALQPFGFMEIKCRYASRSLTPAEAYGTSGFCCDLDASSGNLLLKEPFVLFTDTRTDGNR